MTERRKRIWNKARDDEFPVIEVRPTDPADLDELIAAAQEVCDGAMKRSDMTGVDLVSAPDVDRLRNALKGGDND